MLLDPPAHGHRYVRRAVVVGLAVLLAGCTGSQPGSTLPDVSTEPIGAGAQGGYDPAALVGTWTVTDTRGIQLLGTPTQDTPTQGTQSDGAAPSPDQIPPRPTQLHLTSHKLRLQQSCGTGTGNWQASASGYFVASITVGTADCGTKDLGMPSWLGAAENYRPVSGGVDLLDDAGAHVASLRSPELEGRPAGDRQPNGAIARELQAQRDPDQLPPNLRPATAGQLVGRWRPIATNNLLRGVFLEYERGGTWSASDGCFTRSARWVAGDGGLLLKTAIDVFPAIACAPKARNADWLSASRQRAGFDGNVLVVFDDGGREVGRLRR